MADILIYSKEHCPFCNRAKILLEQLGQSYEDIDIGKQPELRDEMIEKAGGRKTVPQIFINGRHIGGCDDLFERHAAGELVPMFG